MTNTEYTTRPDQSTINKSSSSTTSSASSYVSKERSTNNKETMELTETTTSEKSKSGFFKMSLWTKLFPKEAKEPYKGRILNSNYKTVKRQLGYGSTGFLKLVTKLNDDSGKVYAVKVFYKPKWGETYEDVENRVGNEFCINSGLIHLNVLKVYELIKDDMGHWCQVMDYCQGGDLHHIINYGFLHLPEINCIFKQLINGINYLHKMGVAHLDIKPENLLIDQYCVLKIADFGCAVSFCTNFNTPCDVVKGLRGSKPYMAPEMIDEYNVDGYDAQLLDVWASGILYLTLVHNTVPFPCAKMSNKSYRNFIDSRYTEEGSQLLKDLPKGAKDVMLRMLEPDTQHRENLSTLTKHPWIESLEICQMGQASSAFHNHFAESYKPNQF